MRLGHLVVGLTAIGLLASCSPEPNRAADLADMMEGQFASLETDTENNFRDRRTKIASLGEGEWLYSQINTGAENKVYRQRVIQLMDVKKGIVEQRAYTLNAEENFVDAGQKSIAISFEDLTPAFAEGCAQIWTWERNSGIWNGLVNHETCTIYSTRREKDIGIGARAKVTGDALFQAEAGYELDGTQIWGTKDGEFIELRRVEE